MDIPQPPDDQEQRNIIDKLAQFVARNGPEFEKMTRVKQRKNPKFAFLFHGEFFNYYQYKVTTEQQILKQQQSRMSGTVGGGGNSQGPSPWQQQQQQQQQQDATESLSQNLPPWRKLSQGPSGGPTQNLPPWQQGPSPQAQSGAPPLPPWQQSGSQGGGPSQVLPPPWQQGPPLPPWQQGPPLIGPGLGGVPPWQHGAPAAGAALPPWQQASQVPSSAPPPWQQQGQGSPGQQGLPPWQQSSPVGASGTEVCATGPQVQEQIQQSLQNLEQQQQHLMQQQQVLHPGAYHPLHGTEQIEAALLAAQEQRLQDHASEVQVDLEEFDTVLQPIIDSCTKDAISNGKTWIFSKAKSQEQCTLLADYLKWRIMKPGENFKLHLHLIYLINDVLHHCQRKQAQDLQCSLEKVVVPIFCTAFLGAEEEKQQKLNKLLALWEKNNYFEERIIAQLKDPSTSLAHYQAWLVTEFASVVQPIHLSLQQQMKSLQMQHKNFVDHLTQGRPPPVPSVPPALSPSEGQPPQTSEQGPLEGPSSSGSGSSGEQVSQSGIAAPGPTEVSIDAPQLGQQPAFGGQQGNTWPSQQGPFNPQQPPPPWATNPATFGQPPPPPPPPPPPVGNYNQLPPLPGPGGFNQPPLPGFLHGRPPPMPPHIGPPGPQCPPGAPNHPPAFQLGIPPPGLLEYAQAPPDFSKPPPGFPTIPPPNMSPKAPLPTVDPNDPSLLPTVPYYELPAGLMAPLVKLEECEYRSLDPTDIRLPPPMPPSDRLLEAVRAFYSPASHERPRNSHPPKGGQLHSEGWEHNGLYEFFRAKMRARRRRDEQSRNEGHSLSRSRSHSQRSSSSRSESSSSSSSRSNSRSPRRRRSYSRSRSRSHSPRHRRRSRSRSPRHRDSMSHPPPIGIADYRLGEENKGHQLLMKMGWSGAGGLGANEQGREDPIKGGEIRDHWNQYKGIGVPLDDPFENFRRSKSNTFIARLMARTDPLAANQPTEKPTE
uniref:calcium homeostasis endoplasmic reticulum protein n=1 Tax=Myxine glutinosa TaxID=7769 RepID=UPI00358F7615